MDHQGWAGGGGLAAMLVVRRFAQGRRIPTWGPGDGRKPAPGVSVGPALLSLPPLRHRRHRHHHQGARAAQGGDVIGVIATSTRTARGGDVIFVLVAIVVTILQLLDALPREQNEPPRGQFWHMTAGAPSQ